MPSSIESVASFSVVLAEAFAGIGLSTLVPNSFIALTKMAKGATAAVAATLQSKINDANIPGAKEATAIMLSAATSLDSMDIMLPVDAKIHAEFEFQGSDKMAENLSAGGKIEMVSVKAGYSAMYESKSSNKITLDVNFRTVHIGLESPVVGASTSGTPTPVHP